MIAEPQPRSERLLRRTLLLGALTFGSRLLGFVRETVIAALLGAGAAADAFFVAFRLPNLVRQLLADGVLQPATLPVLAPLTADRLTFARTLTRLAGALAIVLLLLTVLLWLAAPLLVVLLAPGYADDSAQRQLCTELLRITLLYLLPGSLGALLTVALLAQGRDWLVGLSPLLPNLALIAVPLWLAGTTSALHAVAIALLLGGILQLLVPLWTLLRSGWLVWPLRDWRDPQVRLFLGLLWPTLLGGLVQQLNVLIGMLLASFLTAGSISWLYLADRLLQFPQGIIGSALGAVLLQRLVADRGHSGAHPPAAVEAWAIRLCWWLGLPTGLALLLLAQPLTWTVFGYGRFSASDVVQCVAAATVLGIGLPAFLLARVRASVRQAALDRRTPLQAALLGLLCSALLGLGAVCVLPVDGALPPHAGIALAAALGCWLQWAWLGRGHRDAKAFSRRQLLSTVLASAGLTAWWWWLPLALPDWPLLGALGRLGQTAFLLGSGVLLYALMLLAGGVRMGDLRGPGAGKSGDRPAQLPQD